MKCLENGMASMSFSSNFSHCGESQTFSIENATKLENVSCNFYYEVLFFDGMTVFFSKNGFLCTSSLILVGLRESYVLVVGPVL